MSTVCEGFVTDDLSNVLAGPNHAEAIERLYDRATGPTGN